MEVGAAKAERTHASPARSVRLGVQPGLALCAEPERALVQIELGVRLSIPIVGGKTL